MKFLQLEENESKDNYRILQDYQYTGDDTWTWSVWIEAEDTDLDKIENVTYNLHFTFRDPVRVINTRQNKFKLEASGYGTFTIFARLNFKDKSVVELDHDLELYYPDETEAKM